MPVETNPNSFCSFAQALHSDTHGLDKTIQVILPLIMDVVKCCKYIPGFSEISQGDQVQLLKQGSFECICMNSFNLIDHERGVMLSPTLDYSVDA